MQINKAERTSLNMMEHIDCEVWKRVAENSINKMTRPFLCLDSHHVMKDFVLMHSKLPKGDPIRKEVEVNQKLYERAITGVNRTTKREINQSFFGSNKSGSRMTIGRSKKIPSKMVTQSSDARYPQLSELDATAYPLTLSHIISPEEVQKDQILRVMKKQKHKFYELEEERNKELQRVGEERSNAQRKRISQGRGFTYDYEGKVVSIKNKDGGNIRVFKVNHSFDATSSSKSQINSNKLPKKGPSPRITNVVNKRVVNSHSKTQAEQQPEEGQVNRFGKTVPLGNPFDWFKQGKEMDMGVSIMDVSKQSTIYGQKRRKTFESNMKLSEFKQNKSCFKPRFKTEENKVRRLSGGGKGKTVEIISRKNQLDLESNESKELSQSFLSGLPQKSGIIKKNQKVYSSVFMD